MKELTKRELKLLSPAGSEAAIYMWPVKYREGAKEIIDTIRQVGVEYSLLKMALSRILANGYDLDDFDSMKQICDKYNRSVKQFVEMNKGTSMPMKHHKRPNTELLRHLMNIVYNNSVTDPEKLNSYEPFSPEVYGESSFDIVTKIIEKVKPTENDVFVDLGSGVGNVALQFAGACTTRKCYGIEIRDMPHHYATVMEKNFVFWMKWFGKTFTEFELINGDFLDESFREVISDSSIIFTNNFAFGPGIDHQLKQRLSNHPEQTRIISTKPFASLNTKITHRNLNDLASILSVEEIKSDIQTVSWTGKPISYYLHTIDRTKLEKYFERKKLGLLNVSDESDESSPGRGGDKKKRHHKKDTPLDRLYALECSTDSSSASSLDSVDKQLGSKGKTRKSKKGDGEGSPYTPTSEITIGGEDDELLEEEEEPLKKKRKRRRRWMRVKKDEDLEVKVEGMVDDVIHHPPEAVPVPQEEQAVESEVKEVVEEMGAPASKKPVVGRGRGASRRGKGAISAGNKVMLGKAKLNKEEKLAMDQWHEETVRSTIESGGSKHANDADSFSVLLHRTVEDEEKEEEEAQHLLLSPPPHLPSPVPSDADFFKDCPPDLKRLLYVYKQDMLHFIHLSQTPEYRKFVEVEIAKAQTYQMELLSKKERLESQLNALISDTVKMLGDKIHEVRYQPALPVVYITNTGLALCPLNLKPVPTKYT